MRDHKTTRSAAPDEATNPSSTCLSNIPSDMKTKPDGSAQKKKKKLQYVKEHLLKMIRYN